jgi:hypothetical protein
VPERHDDQGSSGDGGRIEEVDMAAFTVWDSATRLILYSGNHPAPRNITLEEGQEIDLTGAYSDVEWQYDETGNRIPMVIEKTPQELQAEVVMAVQNRLDDFARTRSYDSILSAATYATSAVPQFATEGQYALQARDATWAKLYQMLAEVQGGTRPIPTGFADIEGELPALEWPT